MLAGSYPPLVINITDGKATDGNPELGAEVVRSLTTSDGRAQTTCRFPPHQSGKKTLQALDDPVLRPFDKKTTGRKAAGFLHDSFHQKDYGMRKYNHLLKQDLRPRWRKTRKKFSATSR